MCWCHKVPECSALFGLACSAVCSAFTFSLEEITGPHSKKNQNTEPDRGQRPPPWRQNGNTHILHKPPRWFALVPPIDRNLRSRQECARAWLWLSSKQISIQVCSARPHSYSLTTIYVSGAALTLSPAVKQE